ncbi:Fe-S oxidoreductase [Desulfatibacillum alkenivorans DSM 16219]|jgi:Fe-S oxidoreductase|uniref:Fe-S oxidoreductase n=1 Tax=Desulfatibacillum alkenivorans DSM 16219 TaxID=1121393 RepID=A0A1M6Z9Y3_9BACT|nr:(Fe-S)-binding protein [Desulfatibacillum alkenivorans]SHL27241.1 Fe-S oxidoreductase [Desulfatibacillum alkenivorans DSM 16219]
MALIDYHYEMSHCHRCSYCKFIPFQLIKSKRFSYLCPSISLRNFHSFSAGGRAALGLAVVEGRLDEYTDMMKQIVFECTMCGACQVQCRTFNFNLNPIEVMQALRTHFVEQGEMMPEHMFVIEGLKREDNVFGEPKKHRGDWAEGLGLKDISREKVDVLLHVGCRMSFDDEFWPILKMAVEIMKSAGLSVGIAGAEESCCGGRALEMGFEGVFQNFAEAMAGRVKASGAKQVVTLCADCFGTFNEHYPAYGWALDAEVVHITQFINNLISRGKLTLKNQVPMAVTYHDPCHLGRRGEPGVQWKGEYKRLGPHLFGPVPEKPIRLGQSGCYDAPREILEAIPGVELTEMERTREYSWCCGAGGGVLEAFEEMAEAAASERIQEAEATGAKALVTACPWCERNFKDTLEITGGDMKIYDIVELVHQAIGG